MSVDEAKEPDNAKEPDKAEWEIAYAKTRGDNHRTYKNKSADIGFGDKIGEDVASSFAEMYSKLQSVEKQLLTAEEQMEYLMDFLLEEQKELIKIHNSPHKKLNNADELRGQMLQVKVLIGQIKNLKTNKFKVKKKKNKNKINDYKQVQYLDGKYKD